jgi:hypothetical protein
MAMVGLALQAVLAVQLLLTLVVVALMLALVE